MENGSEEKLTPREIEVLKLIATGLSTKQIADSLGIAFKTAACHRSRLMDKLGIHQIANLTRYAIRNGYVDLGGAADLRDSVLIELFQQIKTAESGYRRAMQEYGDFIRDRDTIGLDNPDGATGARRLRQAEALAHREYHAALLALKDLLQKPPVGQAAPRPPDHPERS
jgi:DNA-binding CsgD family transcriptional regulator